MRKTIPLTPTPRLPPHDRLLLGETLSEAVDTADPEAWVDLDRRIRSATARPGGGQPRGAGLPQRRADEPGAGDWAAAPRWDEEALDVTWSRFPPSEPENAIVLCHDRWQAREAALAFTAGRPALLPLLLTRCADSHPRVRERARRMAVRALDASGSSASRMVPLALRLSLRPHGGWALEHVMAAAGPLPTGPAALIRTSPLPPVRVRAARLCLERGLLTAADLAELALGAPDRAVRHLCLAALLAQVTADASRQLLAPLLAASSAVARSSGVMALHRVGRGREAAAHLTDPSARVRSAARLVLTMEGEDPPSHYRALCADPAAPGLPPGAVFGLAETGAPGATALLRPLAAHPEGRVRAAALAALLMTDTLSPDELMAAMEDPHPPVVRTARKALVPYVLLVPETWLASLLAPARPRHVRRAGLRLLCAHGLELRKRLLAPLELDDDPEVAHEAQRARYEPLPPDGSHS
ncbi:HEAT repeat domain-containing protein [Streptomyces fulvorobeus]|uniref:HEAT repeat domain-containing protein n=1 Tax=Streptomyces fulvorobeus TaxID=284028 RepID=A0A7J0CET8_9ACTN|nr:HEAT repeat domain-containing protein [Streptomyces fulvorobeus]NYE44480.1 hypothetical protein [Streptomyces fulvorobeus]GFN01012.1 hypothetical protein Sfulv_58220 [Streptomyces fulvorobeus]